MTTMTEELLVSTGRAYLASSAQYGAQVETQETSQQPSSTHRHVCPHPQCNKSYRRPSDLARHAKIHAKSEPCPVCGVMKADRRDVQRHMKSNHRRQMADYGFEEYDVPDCPDCGTSFSRSDFYTRHRNQGRCKPR
ncbi:zinc finger protein [Colletotrichum musicola]|uniref:Zinc finger protein n=1 Tax=Colletotrichum musicola TaxID=2175873 RepID=A0A8H6JNC1_9PEZI|nr:zinc finger protein [Colletotrichum musicola]